MKDEIIKIAKLFKAFGDPNRSKIIKLLTSNIVATVCIADLAKCLGITESATSQHIKVLKNLEILSPNKVEFRVFYSIDVNKLMIGVVCFIVYKQYKIQ